MRNKFTTIAIILFLITASSLLFSSCQNITVNEDLGQAPENEEAIEQNSKNNHDGVSGEEIEEKINKGAGPEEDPVLIPEMLSIGIYSGQGVWDKSVEAIKNFLDAYSIEWKVFDEKDAVNLDLKDHFDLLWFPGGFAAEYKNYIADHSGIIDFVKEGGSFVGSCAGAYYAADILRWDGTDYEYPLRLFDGKATGPLYGQIAWGEIGTMTLETEHPANRGFNTEVDMYYFDGPYFDAYEEDAIVVLARYKNNQEPAVIAGSSGDGKYLLLGPHPEIGGYTAQNQDFNLDGQEGAKWPWLYAALEWFAGWE